ncbi:hypothetical protein G9A89_007958 [Geosiphon pyriformis]|nr:hypothetical protein G9A89_007958 [Geosiphon pyriformis]
MAATSFTAQTPDPNEQLIDRLTANLLKQSEKINNSKDPDLNPILINPSNSLIKNNKIVAHLDYNIPSLPPSASRNNDNQNNRTINNNVSNQRPNHANINFFGEDPLVEVTDESTSQPKENPFYAFNLTNNNHDMNKLTINTSESTRKKKKAKVNFVINPKKASTSTADNNKPPKAKVFKNSPKKDLHKLLIPKKKTPKTNKHPCQFGFADNNNVTPLICKAQVAGYFIDLILNSRSSYTFIIIIPVFKVSNNNTNSKVTTVINRGTSKDTTKNINQVEENSTVNTEKEGNSTFIPNQMPVKKTRSTISPFRFEHNSITIGSVNTSTADFSPLTGNRLEEKPNKKYKHLEKISVKGLTERFNQGASKYLKKLNRLSKLLIEDVERAAQIEAALKKYNPEILDIINKGKFVKKTDKQMDNLFETNKDIANLKRTAENMEDSESDVSSRMLSPSLGQKSNKLSEKNVISTEANQEEGWRTVVHGTKRHVLFVQILDIPEKNMKKKVEWIYNLLKNVSYLLGAVMVRNQEIRIDFSQIAKRDQARKILADADIESFLMATNSIANQMAGQKKVLVRNISLGISDREVGTAMKKFGEVKKIQIKMAGKWQSAVVEFNNQEEVTRAVDQWLTLIRKNAVRIYPMIGTQKIIKQRKTWKAKLVGLSQNCTAHYLSTTLDQIKA